MKKVLVTGASGFIGRFVVAELSRLNTSVIATYSQHNIHDHDGLINVIPVHFDLSQIDPDTNYFKYFDEPDVVIHLAWEGLPNYKSPLHQDVYLPRHKLFLENMLLKGLKNLTVTGTCFEYGMQEGLLSEAMLANPDNSYGIAKNELRKFLEQLQQHVSFSLKWPRLFYLYGKGQNRNSLLSQLDDALDNGQDAFKMSGGLQTRDYLPVATAAAYIVRLAMQDRITGVINCCSGKPTTVLSFVEDYLKKTNRSIPLQLGYYPYPDYEPFAFWGDATKLNSIIADE